MNKTIEERAKELCEKESWSYELIEPIVQALIEVRNEAFGEAAMIAQEFITPITGRKTEVGNEIAQAIRERIKGKV